jgi:hypothetical protein
MMNIMDEPKKPLFSKGFLRLSVIIIAFGAVLYACAMLSDYNENHIRSKALQATSLKAETKKSASNKNATTSPKSTREEKKVAKAEKDRSWEPKEGEVWGPLSAEEAKKVKWPGEN